MINKSTININQLFLDLESKDYQTRWFAAEVLGTKRDLNENQKMKLMKMVDKSDVGEVIVWGLGQMKAKGTESAAEKMLEHKNNYFSWRAAESLRDLGTEKARLILESTLDKSKSAETRWKCAWALGEIGSIKSFEVLWKHLQDEDRYVRWKSVWAISILKGNIEERMVEKLNQGINDFLAWRCIWILGKVGDEKTADYLESLQVKNLYPSKYVNYQLELSVSKIRAKRYEK
jgi:HEAT repeat protein